MLNGKVFSVSQFSVGSWNLLRSTQFPFCDRSAIASPGDHAAPAVLHRCCFQGAGSTWGTRLGPARTLLLPRCFLDAWRKRKDTLRIWYSKCGKLQVFEAPFFEDGLLLNLLQNSKKCYFLWMVYWFTIGTVGMVLWPQEQVQVTLWLMECFWVPTSSAACWTGMQMWSGDSTRGPWGWSKCVAMAFYPGPAHSQRWLPLVGGLRQSSRAFKSYQYSSGYTSYTS